MAKTITIVGVTGTQGSAVAKTFLATPGWRVRGLTRSIDSPAAQRQSAGGVELVEADLNDRASLVKAFQGSHCIYANTDFFALTKSPDLQTLLDTTYSGKALNEACMQHEFEQGKNMVEAAAQVLAAGSPLEVFILSTLSHASKWSGGDITHVLHFDVKWMIQNYLQEQLPELASKTRYLQVGFYMSNAVNPILLPRKSEQGVFEFRWANISPSTMLPATCPEQDTGIFVRSLISAPPGTMLLGASDPLTVEELLQTWTRVTGHPAKLVTISTKELESLVEPVMPSFGKEFAENFQYYRDYTYTGRDPNVVLPEDLGIDKADLTTYEEYLAGCDWDTLLRS